MTTKIHTIYYFNLFGNGDLHYSREFIKDFILKIPIKSFYTHKKCPLILRDVSVEYSSLMPSQETQPNETGFFVENNILFCGTWIGQHHYKWCNSTGCCNIKNNYNMYSSFANILNIQLKNELDYIPEIDYSKYSIDDIKITLDKNILVSNGMCMSGQAMNFDMNPMIVNLASKHPSCTFYVTHAFPTDLKNIVDCNSIISEKTNSNLNEISYISTLCDIIIGRGSGPFCFTHVKENLYNKNKTYISTGNTEREINWVTMSDYNLTEHAKQLWVGSHHDTPDRLYDLIDKEINEKFGNR